MSIVSADRMCTGCGHNLCGQGVVREPHYELLVARCPECGTVAAMQEYPLLGRWANRLGVAMAAIAVVLAVAATILSAVILGAISSGIGGEFGSPLTNVVHTEFDRWVAANFPGRQSYTIRGTPDGLKWWTEQGGIDGFVAAHGGWTAIVDRRAALYWIPSALAAAAIGIFWSVALLGVPRRRLWTIASVVIGLAALVVGFVLTMDAGSIRFGNWMDEVYFARHIRIGAVMSMATLLLLAPCLVVGLLIGRPIARFAAIVFLPPRFRGVLSILWTTDGKPYPKWK